MKMTNKYLAPYLQFRLHGVGPDGEVGQLSGVNTYMCYTNAFECNIEEFKPVLKPLSNLIQKDTTGVHVEAALLYETFDLAQDDVDVAEFVQKIRSKEVTQKQFNILLGLHYDVFDLIPNGLAVDNKAIEL